MICFKDKLDSYICHNLFNGLIKGTVAMSNTVFKVEDTKCTSHVTCENRNKLELCKTQNGNGETWIPETLQ